jgi:hypothetical protein
MKPRKQWRRRHTPRVDLVMCPQLSAGIGMKHSVGTAHGPATACLARHGSMPRRPLHALAVAVASRHARHRSPLHDDRLLGTRFPDPRDRREGGNDRGGDEQPNYRHLTLAPAGHGSGLRFPAVLRSPLKGSSTRHPPGLHRPYHPFRLKRSVKPCRRWLRALGRQAATFHYSRPVPPPAELSRCWRN